MNSLAYTIFGGFAMALADSVPGIYKLSSLFLGFVIASLPLVVAEQRAVMGSLRRGACRAPCRAQSLLRGKLVRRGCGQKSAFAVNCIQKTRRGVTV